MTSASDIEPNTRPRVAVEVPGIAKMAKANATLVNCEPNTEMVRAKNSRRNRGLVLRERSATRTGCLEAVISKWFVVLRGLRFAPWRERAAK
jgi:hypothetical protein